MALSVCPTIRTPLPNPATALMGELDSFFTTAIRVDMELRVRADTHLCADDEGEWASGRADNTWICMSLFSGSSSRDRWLSVLHRLAINTYTYFLLLSIAV